MVLVRHSMARYYFVLAVLVSASGLIAACGDGSTGARAVPLRVAHADLTIGQLDGDDAYLFGVIAGLAVDEAGRIYVLDQQANTVRVFDSGGRHLRSLGREGSGPGELREPCCLGISPLSELWVRDNGNNRYVSFDMGGSGRAAGTTVRMQHSDVNRWATVTFDEDGRLIDVGSRPDTAGGEPRTVRFHLSVGATDAAAAAFVLPLPLPPVGSVHVVRIPVQRGSAVMQRSVYQPYGSRHLIAYGPRGVFAEAAAGEYSIRVYASDGNLSHRVGRTDVAGPLVTPQQRASAESTIARDARFVGRNPGAMPFAVPERHPPIAELHFDDVGRLWVRVTTLPGETRRMHVYDAAGTHVETVEYPTDVQLGIVGVVRHDLIVGTTTDSLGAPQVVRLQVR